MHFRRGSRRARSIGRSPPPFWRWQALIINAEFARANGWLAQVRSLAQEHRTPGVPAGGDPRANQHLSDPDRSPATGDDGWFQVADAYSLIAVADYDAAVQLLARAVEVGSRLGQIDLVAFATMIRGRALIKSGRLKEGLSRIDEAMLLVVDPDTSPRATSMVYCSAIGTCQEAREFSSKLFFSERTVHRHIANIFDKLAVRSRAAAASYGIRHNIVDAGIL